MDIHLVIHRRNDQQLAGVSLKNYMFENNILALQKGFQVRQQVAVCFNFTVVRNYICIYTLGIHRRNVQRLADVPLCREEFLSTYQEVAMCISIKRKLNRYARILENAYLRLSRLLTRRSNFLIRVIILVIR